VDLVEGGEGHVGVLLGEHLGDGRGEGGLAVVDVAHRPHVEVGLGALEHLLGHTGTLSSLPAGSGGRTRTADSSIMSRVLCQLSYAARSLVDREPPVGIEPTTPALPWLCSAD